MSANSFMKLSLIPTSVSAPEAAPAAAPIAMPMSGFRKIRPISDPQKPPLTAPTAVRLTAWCNLILPCSILNDDDRVFEIQQVFTLQLPQFKANLFRLKWIIVAHHN